MSEGTLRYTWCEDLTRYISSNASPCVSVSSLPLFIPLYWWVRMKVHLLKVNLASLVSDIFFLFFYFTPQPRFPYWPLSIFRLCSLFVFFFIVVTVLILAQLLTLFPCSLTFMFPLFSFFSLLRVPSHLSFPLLSSSSTSLPCFLPLPPRHRLFSVDVIHVN